jgi:enamine deaminase RidA (YjgF/YER057c/UK114 family)
LVTLEGAERDRAAHLGLQLAKLGLDIATVRSAAVAKQARQMAALAQALCEEVGLDWADDATRRIAQRAVLRASERQSASGPFADRRLPGR